MVSIRYQRCETVTQIAAHGHVQSRSLQDIVGKHGRCGLTITTRDRDYRTVAIAVSEFDLTDHWNTFLARRDDRFGSIGNARTLHNG